MVIRRVCTGPHPWVLPFILPLELRAGPGPRSEHRTLSQRSHRLLPAPDCRWHCHEKQLREVKPGSSPQAAHSSCIALQEPVCSLPCLPRSVGSAGSCGHIPAQLQRPGRLPWSLDPLSCALARLGRVLWLSCPILTGSAWRQRPAPRDRCCLTTRCF